jgi:hypothetical protein
VGKTLSNGLFENIGEGFMPYYSFVFNLFFLPGPCIPTVRFQIFFFLLSYTHNFSCCDRLLLSTPKLTNREQKATFPPPPEMRQPFKGRGGGTHEVVCGGVDGDKPMEEKVARSLGKNKQ